jgi:hypothetical protein
MYNPMESRELIEVYEQSEYLKLKVWDAIETLQDRMELEGEITSEERFVDAEAAFDGKVLKIVINDCIPREVDFKRATSSLLRKYWRGCVVRAIRKLPYPVAFDKAICIIKMFTPKNIEWDVDNRAFRMIINALRGTQVIKGDSWNKLSVILIGGVDKKNPRTEVYVAEYPENDIISLLKGKA